MPLKLIAGVIAVHPDLPKRAHVTFAFDDVKEMKKLGGLPYISLHQKIVRVEYLEPANVTVLILEKDAGILGAKLCFEDLGMTYDKEFVPHITVSFKDDRHEWQHMIGTKVALWDSYMHIKDFK